MKKRSIDGDMVYRAAIVIGNNDGNRFSSFVYAEVAKEALEAALNLPEPEIAVSEKMIEAGQKAGALVRGMGRLSQDCVSIFRAMRRVQIEEELTSIAEQQRFNHPREMSGPSHHMQPERSDLRWTMHRRKTDK